MCNKTYLRFTLPFNVLASNPFKINFDFKFENFHIKIFYDLMTKTENLL